MTVLTDYAHFAGRHWESGTIHNYFAYRATVSGSPFIAPHSGQPYSEALLVGISGGAVMGYFSFAYEGYDPMARILTRNTFDPLERMLARPGIIQHRQETTSAAKGVRNLLAALEDGVPAIVWADLFSLPYNALPEDDGMWGMMPLLVYGYDEAADTVHIADRAAVPLTVTTGELAAARSRVKKDRFRVLTLDPPDPAKLPGAVQAGIWDCIRLYTEAPPKGARHNFGLAAFDWWARLLTKPGQRKSWAKVFPPGVALYAGLTSAYTDITHFGKAEIGQADRDLYADFLDEAALLLDRPALRDAAAIFRRCGAAWRNLAACLLPDDIPPLAETRALMDRRHGLFLQQGGAALTEIQAIDGQLAAIREALAADFPLDAAGVAAFQERIADALIALRDVEAEAVTALQSAMG